MRFKNALVAGSTALVLTGMFAGAVPARAAATDSNDCAHQTVRTLDLTIRPAKTRYGPGETVEVLATVVRGPSETPDSDTDYLTPDGHPTPAEDAAVVVSLKRGGLLITWAGAMTDESGLATLELTLPPSVQKGPLTATGYAIRKVHECLYEDSNYVKTDRFITITSY